MMGRTAASQAIRRTAEADRLPPNTNSPAAADLLVAPGVPGASGPPSAPSAGSALGAPDAPSGLGALVVRVAPCRRGAVVAPLLMSGAAASAVLRSSKSMVT